MGIICKNIAIKVPPDPHCSVLPTPDFLSAIPVGKKGFSHYSAPRGENRLANVKKSVFLGPHDKTPGIQIPPRGAVHRHGVGRDVRLDQSADRQLADPGGDIPAAVRDSLRLHLAFRATAHASKRVCHTNAMLASTPPQAALVSQRCR